MKRKIIITVIFITVFFICLLAIKIYNKPYIDVKEAASNFVITSELLVHRYSTDEKTSNAEYLEKIIEVKGSVKEVRKEKDLNVIVLNGGDSEGAVICYLLKGDDITKTPKVGELVVIKGICTGYLLDVILVRCVLIK